MVYVTDLGLAKYDRPDRWSFDNPPSRATPTRPPQLVGTYRYASIKGHLGSAQSRRDDLEALGYMLVYFRRGKLPWQGLKGKRDAKYLQVLEKKRATSASELCVGLPESFEQYMTYVRKIDDKDVPDYRGLRKMFDKLFREQGFERDNVFDWKIREFQRLEPDVQEPLASRDAGNRRGEAATEPLGDAAWNVTEAARRKRR